MISLRNIALKAMQMILLKILILRIVFGIILCNSFQGQLKNETAGSR